MIALIEHRKITTTITKAKAIQPEIESLITLGRQDTPHNRRMALSRLASKKAMRDLFAFAPTQYATRSSGFTRITKIGPRLGDGAEMAQIELL
jgi:large subunit ribosomal protein L17